MEQGLDLGINGYASFELFGKTFWLTNTHISVIIVVLVITILPTGSAVRPTPQRSPARRLTSLNLW